MTIKFNPRTGEWDCIPTIDFCDLPVLPRGELKELTEHLHKLAEKIVDTVPSNDGALRWAKVLL